MTSQPVRVIVADDQTLFRTGLAQLLANDPRIDVVGEAVDGADAVQQCERLKPDVVLMDLRMPSMDGLEATRRIVRSIPTTRVLVLTTFDADSEVLDALRAGASGYVLKDSELEAIICSVLSVQLGEQVLSGSVAQHMLDIADDSTVPDALHNTLTARETQVLKMIAAGTPNKQVARQLGISDKTVRNHLSHIYEKLQVVGRSQALLYAMRSGMVKL